MKKPELAFKCFIRFLLARAAMTWGVELMAGAFRVYQFYRQGRMGRVIIMKNAAKGGGGMTTDEALYRRYLSGDEDALGTLMERYGTKLTLYLDGYLCDLHEAEDLMIEAFAHIFARERPIQDGCFKAYLYKTGRNLALRCKTRRRFFLPLEELPFELPDEALAETGLFQNEQHQQLYAALGKLKKEYRETLFLVYFEELSYRQAAQVLGRTEQQVTNLVYRGKQQLKQLLEQEGYQYEN